MLARAAIEEGRATMTRENLLARYSVLHELGRGAMGAVYAARDRETGAVVALKRLDPGASGKPDANFAARFLKRARSARLLKHRNIVAIHDAGEVGGIVYVAMEMLEGQSLRALLDAGPLPVTRAIQIAHDVACGLAHAHLEGVVHGAIKPSNVIVLRSGAVKITDFGVGEVGCLSYMSPEQLRGERIDHRCDIFSLGALFYEMLARRRPFEGGSAKEIVENILRAKPPLPSDLNPHVSRALDAIVLRMLAPEPAGRMPGVPILLRDLQHLEEGLGLASAARAGTEEPKASVPPERPEPRTRTPDAIRPRDTASMPAPDYHKAMAIMERESRSQRPSGSRPAVFAAAVALAALGVGFAGFKYYYSSDPSERGIAASRMKEAPPTALAASRPAARAPVAETAEEERAQGEPLATVSAPIPMPPQPPAAEQPASAGAAPPQEPPQAMQAAAKTPAPQPEGTAQVIVAVSPRGEIYVNGKHHGTTPPIGTLYLEPGMHRIEVRSGSRKPYLTYMTVQAGDVRRIRHDFDARRALVPPKRASRENRGA